MAKPPDCGDAGNIFRRLIHLQISGDLSFETSSGNGSSISSCQSGPAASASVTLDALQEGCVRDTASILSLQPWIFQRGNDARHGRSLVTSRRSRRRRSVRPLKSTDYCLIPPICGDCFEVDEFTFSSIATPAAPTAIAGDPRTLNSGISGNAVLGIAPLPELPRRRPKRSRIQSPVFEKTAKNGGHRQLLVFALGFVAGAAASWRELERVTRMLRQSQSLVQDLQEELEMKEAITFEELSEELSGRFGDGEAGPPMSIIEAELKAELERLEFNMSADAAADSSEDSDAAVGSVVRGELREERLDWQDQSASSSSDYSKPAGGDRMEYPVSPRELSLRLHEVAQRQLEERIKELEAALDVERKRLQMLADSAPPVCNATEAYEEFHENDADANGHNHGQEEDELLIRRLLERTRQGSPAVMQALLSVE